MNLVNTLDLKESLLAKFNNTPANKTSAPSSVSDRQEQAFQHFQRVGFPTNKQEEYKYTNMAEALKKVYALESTYTVDNSDLASVFLKGFEANNLVFVNGKYAPELSTILEPASNLEIKSFEDADSKLLDKYFAKEVYTAQDPFAELNTAFAENGIVIRIPKGKHLAKPVALYYISTTSGTNVFSQPRNLILAEENTQVQFVEVCATLGEGTSFTNSVTELYLLQDALVDYYKLQDDADSSYQVNTTVVSLEGKSNFNAATITLNGAIIRNNLNVILKSQYSEATFYGLYFLKDKQLVDNHTMVDHAVPNCQSNELYKGMLDGRSTGVFNGKIFVKQDAQKTNAFQSNKNILLSKDAVMNTKPQLEIFADDVKCSHGATIGQLEKEPMFYLRSRGLSEESARALLLVAFAQDIIDHIKIEPLQEYLSKAIEQRLIK